MNTEQNTPFASSGFVREEAVRRALTRRRRARATTTTANRPAALRRWSVAELIANGVPRPPAGQTAH
jgi:hypothetical protein